jgi:hypothetical protein
MSPVTLPTVVAQSAEVENGEAGEESPLRLRAQIGADSVAEEDAERPL